MGGPTNKKQLHSQNSSDYSSSMVGLMTQVAMVIVLLPAYLVSKANNDGSYPVLILSIFGMLVPINIVITNVALWRTRNSSLSPKAKLVLAGLAINVLLLMGYILWATVGSQVFSGGQL